MNLSNAKNITIVGAGLVGSLLAVLLKKRGYGVTLYERRPDPRRAGAERGRSINLVVTSRGLHGLERAGLASDVMKITTPVFGRMIHSIDGETQFQPYGRTGECNHSVSRAELNQFLLDQAQKCGVKILFDHRLSAIDFEKQKIQFENGAAAGYEILFGADGAGSAVRHQLVKHLAKPDLETVDFLEADYKELLMPAPAQRAGHAMDVNALHIWPRGSHMLMGLANNDGSFTMTLYLLKKGPKSFEAVKTPAQIRSLFDEEFRDAVPMLPDYVDDFIKNPQGPLATVHCKRWVEGPVALIGDAAHAIVPFFGQGMNCGFEDCTVLLDLMDQFEGDWSRVLQAYEASRRVDADAIAGMAEENWAEMKDKVGDQKFLLRKKVEAWLEEKFPSEYRSRYGIVTYTLIPYHLARKAGEIQSRLLDRLCDGITMPSEINENEARSLLAREFQPFLRDNKLNLKSYAPAK